MLRGLRVKQGFLRFDLKVQASTRADDLCLTLDGLRLCEAFCNKWFCDQPSRLLVQVRLSVYWVIHKFLDLRPTKHLLDPAQALMRTYPARWW